MADRDQYRRMLKDCISPELRSGGWTGGSGKYYLRGNSGHVGSLIISGNPKRSTAQICTFGVHIGVVSTYLRAWREGTSQPSRAKPSYWSDHDWFSEVAKDLTIGEHDDPFAVGHHVLILLHEGAIPAVKASLTDEGLRVAVDECPVGVGRGGARLLMEIAQGHFQVAHEWIESGVKVFGADDPGLNFLRERLALPRQRGSSPSGTELRSARAGADSRVRCHRLVGELHTPVRWHYDAGLLRAIGSVSGGCRSLACARWPRRAGEGLGRGSRK